MSGYEDSAKRRRTSGSSASSSGRPSIASRRSDLRRRQSSLSSQLSNVTTFSDAEEDNERDAEPLELSSSPSADTSLDPSSSHAHTLTTSSFPARRISSTPLFPSPLAQALSPHIDDIEPLEMDTDEALEADDEEEEAIDTTSYRSLEVAPYPLAKSPTMRGGSPLRREVGPLQSHGELSHSRASSASTEASGIAILAPSSSERRSPRRASQTLPAATSPRLRSTSADPSAETRRLSGSPHTASAPSLWPQSSAQSMPVNFGDAAADSSRAPSKISSSPTSSRRSSLSVFSSSPSSPRVVSPNFAQGPPSMPVLPPAPPESIKLQRVPSAVRAAQALHPPSSSPSSPSSIFHELPRPSGAPNVSPTPTPSASRASSSREGTTPAAVSDESDSPLPGAPLQRAATSSGTITSAFSPLFNLSPSAALGQESSNRQRSRTVADPADVFSVQPDSGTRGLDSETVVRSPRNYGASPLSRGISPLALAGTGGRAFSVYAPANPPPGAELSTPISRRSHVRRSLAPTTPFGAADGNAATDEYARIIMQSRTAKMQKWKIDAELPELSFSPAIAREAITDEADIADATDASTLEGGVARLDENMRVGTGKDIEWVDWLEEYRRMKEKVRADQEHETSDSAAFEVSSKPPIRLARASEEIEQSPNLPNQDPLASMPPLDRIVSTDSSSPGSRRKRNFGGFARIDAWWSAVRNSFQGQPDDPKSPNGPPPPLARPQSLVPLTASTSRRSALKSKGSREEMPPPPVPLRASYSSAEFRAGSETGAAHSGPLAPAATIDTQPRRNPSAATMTQMPQRPKPSATTSYPVGSAVRKTESKRKNPQLSLRLDGNAFQPENNPPSGEGGIRAASSFLSSSRRPGSFENTMERTPGLTPGHSPAWTKTPSILPVSHSDSSGAPLAPAPLHAREQEHIGASTFSMPAIKQHIRHRLTFAKDSCDRELRKISAGITSHVEQEMRLERLLGTDDTGPTGSTTTFHGKATGDSSPWSAMTSDVEAGAESDATGADDSDAQQSGRRSTLLSTSSAGAEQLSTTVPVLPLQRRPSLAASRGRSHTGDGVRSPRRPSDVKKRLSNQMPRPSDLAAALGRSVPSSSVQSSRPESVASSRSTSRSRSPMPGAAARHHGSEPMSRQGSGRDSTISEPSYMATLQAITAVATEILDTPVGAFTAEPNRCAELVQRVQNIGKAWDEHPDWPCRGWYVQLLLAVAGLSRVVEWWEAEKGFWNFDDDESNDHDLIFVAKAGAQEDRRSVAGHKSSHASPTTTEASPTRVVAVDAAAASPTTAKHSSGQVSPQQARSVKSASDLMAAVEQVKRATILMELDLESQCFEHLSPIWSQVVGLASEDCLGQPIAALLMPADAGVFAEATRQLLADDSHTVEVSFRLRVIDEAETEAMSARFQAMDGKGMLMRSRESGSPTHTMWVVRPRPGSPRLDQDLSGWQQQETSTDLASVVSAARSGQLLTESVLCRICERGFPTWFFEKHCETCNETHRLEMQIGECNDSIAELRGVSRQLLASLAQMAGASTQLEYQGISLVGTSPTATPLQSSEMSRSPRPHTMVLRRLQIKALEHLMEILQTAADVTTPALPEEAAEGIPRAALLLSPASQTNFDAARRWVKPLIEDPALSRLASDVEAQVKDKLAAIDRLQNALFYAERVRTEWQQAVTDVLGELQQPQVFAESTLGLDHLSLSEVGARDDQELFSRPPERSSSAVELRTSDAQIVGDLSSEYAAATTSLGPPVVPRMERVASSSAMAQGLQSLPEAAEITMSRQRSASTSSPANSNSPLASSMPFSPHPATHVSTQRTKASSIKDFDIIKPISKGAFGSVYLSKKKATGDYYAIKMLKKSDMVAKNQVTNVKAERMILMTQSDSDFVVKLFYTFQSRDYLYLVMEYLNGGDCAALVKALGCLEEEWTRSYIAEVVLGLEYLHLKGVVHRDLKPDNLLIDSRGHLKLTDFGLSKIGLLGRQARGPALFPGFHQSGSNDSRTASPSPDTQPRHSYFFPFNSGTGSDIFAATSDSSASGSHRGKQSPLASPFASTAGISQGMPSMQSRGSTESKNRQVVGSPDYIAPESILGLGTGAGVDWWALGVICYEFLYGIPPFHAETPERVFENILSRRISWDDPPVDVSAEARDFMERLLVLEPTRRLGNMGANEVRSHAFLADIDWENLRSGDAAFIPQTTDPESTDYFDARGATHLTFEDQEPVPLEMEAFDSKAPSSSTSPIARLASLKRSPPGQSEASSSPGGAEDFGAFDYKNIEVLKQANDDMIRQIRKDRARTSGAAFEGQQLTYPLSARPSMSLISPSLAGSPQSSEILADSATVSASAASGHERRISEAPTGLNRVVSRTSASHGDLSQHSRRNSLPTRLRTASFSSSSAPSFTASETWAKRRRGSRDDQDTPASSVGSPAAAVLPLEAAAANSPTIDVLVAEDNPISSKVIEVLLTRLGCRVVVVHDGEEAIRSTMGSLKFDVIFLDIAMPVLDGEDTARMIRSTQNVNQATPIVAVTSYESDQLSEAGTVFSAVLSKPVTRSVCSSVLQRLGFSLSKQNS